MEFLDFVILKPAGAREITGNRSQIVSGCVREVCGALACASVLLGLRKPAKITENKSLAYLADRRQTVNF